MWPTVLVIDGTEHRLQKELPALSIGAGILLYLTDKFDGYTRVPAKYKVERVVLDIYNTLQYVYLEKYE